MKWDNGDSESPTVRGSAIQISGWLDPYSTVLPCGKLICSI